MGAKSSKQSRKSRKSTVVDGDKVSDSNNSAVVDVSCPDEPNLQPEKNGLHIEPGTEPNLQPEKNGLHIEPGSETSSQEPRNDTIGQLSNTRTSGSKIASAKRHSRASRESRTSSKRMSFFDIVDANDITSYLVVGNQASAQDDELLTRKKVMFVMNLSNLPLEYIKPEIEYKNIFLEDEEDSDLLSVLEICLKTLQEWKKKCLQTKSRILVYSYNGLSRSSSVVLAHLMNEERLTLKQAWNHLKEKHPSAKPNDGFLLQLIQYEQENYDHRLSMTVADFYGK